MLFSVYVRPKDLPRAKDINDKVFALEVSESEGMPRAEELDLWSCPGCGNRLGEKDLKCSSGGLVLFPAEGWRCSNCDGVVGVNVAVCPHCGSGIDSTDVSDLREGSDEHRENTDLHAGNKKKKFS